MLVFSTRVPLKKEIEYFDCVKLFMKWVIESPNYPINNMEYEEESLEDFDYTKDNVTFSIRHYNNSQVQICACRLENKEANVNWINDCIFYCEADVKTLLIQLNCSRTDYNIDLPETHKPYIVRMFVENRFCADDVGIPIIDEPMEVDDKFYNLCTKVMSGTIQYSMPVVYISCDYSGKTVISPQFLARKLSGVAHVFFEKSCQTALKLREDTNGNNAYAGYVGIYFPGISSCQRYGIEYYSDYKELTNVVINAVWKALINCLDSTKYNWNQIIALQSKQRMEEWQDISASDKLKLQQYVDNFDKENVDLREQVASLNQQVYSLSAQLDSLRCSLSSASQDDFFYKTGKEPDIHIGERNDLLFNILTQALDKYPSYSRGYFLIKTLLEANPKVGENERIIAEVRNIFSDGERLSTTKKARLKALGFSIEEDGPHYKLVFHDQRYMFTVSKTPGDHRGGGNLSSDICKTLELKRKI